MKNNSVRSIAVANKTLSEYVTKETYVELLQENVDKTITSCDDNKELVDVIDEVYFLVTYYLVRFSGELCQYRLATVITIGDMKYAAKFLMRSSDFAKCIEEVFLLFCKKNNSDCRHSNAAANSAMSVDSANSSCIADASDHRDSDSSVDSIDSRSESVDCDYVMDEDSSISSESSHSSHSSECSDDSDAADESVRDSKSDSESEIESECSSFSVKHKLKLYYATIVDHLYCEGYLSDGSLHLNKDMLQSFDSLVKALVNFFLFEPNRLVLSSCIVLYCAVLCCGYLNFCGLLHMYPDIYN